MSDIHVLTRDSLTFPPSRIDTADGIRELNANFRALVRQLEGAATPLIKSNLDDAVAQTWYTLVRSPESRRRHGVYTTILPRLIRVQQGPKHAREKPILCSGRIVLKLSNPEFDPRIAVVTFDAPASDPNAQCTAVLSVVDLIQVRNIGLQNAPAMINPGQGHPLEMMGKSSKASDLGSFLSWAVNEFSEVFLQEPEPEPARSHITHKPPQMSDV